jgi:hypothetical protein
VGDDAPGAMDDFGDFLSRQGGCEEDEIDFRYFHIFISGQTHQDESFYRRVSFVFP